MSKKIKMRVIPDAILEINMDILESGKSRLSKKDDDDNFDKKEAYKQEIKIENISYKRPNRAEMQKYWNVFVKTKKELEDGFKSGNLKNDEEVEGVWKRIFQVWKKEFIRGFFGMPGMMILKKLETEDFSGNISAISLDDSEMNELVQKIATRLKSIKSVENILDFYSKSEKVLKDIDYNLLVIENKLTRRTLCFINNLSKSREEDYSYEKFDFSNYTVNRKINLNHFNKYFNNKFFKGKKVGVVLDSVKKYFDKVYGENLYSLFKVNVETVWKDNIDVFFIRDNKHTLKSKSDSFVNMYVVMVKYRKTENKKFKNLYVDSILLKKVSTFKDLLFRTIKGDGNFKNSDNSEEIKSEKFEKNIEYKLIEYFLR